MIGKQIPKPVNDWSEYTEAALWCNANKAMICDKGDFYEVVALPEQTLEEAKAARLAKLNTAFASASENAHCLSSAGFEINADEIANRNIEGLVLVLVEGESTLFRVYDNSFHEVSKEQLETMRKEIVVNSQRLYRIKWQLEAAIETAETVEELEAIAITFDTVTQDDGGSNEQTA
ncbi:DUF4376 domain-containing protein [Oxalobacter formigenes]|uniref:DUF4376 domain-containing protein n=1 Tax=Oxalobacter formigenes TaxID=847 RepID=UPI0022AF9C13|nr:DUF4376 domain-containing protein [Oxalobacter formigenes]WAW06074.1 DUF4376 domain-containing protein [Oxalobacter formigenes]